MAKRVLIIEDDVYLGDVLSQKLRGGGFEVSFARDGVEGLEKMRTSAPDIVLLDIALPRMDGYQVLEEKRKDQRTARIPVIIVSNSGQPVEINRALALGVKDYFVKTDFNPDEVVTKVKTQLGGGGEERSGEFEVTSGGEAGQDEKKILAGKKVMWVEDDEFLSDVLARKLSSEGCVLSHATDAPEAFRHLAESAPDILLLDILLPGMDGFEILRKVKSEDATKHIPVILLSNLGQRSDIEKGKGLGAARFLIKATVTLDEIVREIADVLKETGAGASKA
jgi:DNA-binding response OmpR family regulator